ncbi:hypothetical protein BaRGS_00026775 [Batillaria attramentaria]|uniref:Uncharacterized protein n=1 Tax=Batillaria attramentaria TaxID=370345 RepID=A0ABD0K3I8_9CAEN
MRHLQRTFDVEQGQDKTVKAIFLRHHADKMSSPSTERVRSKCLRINLSGGALRGDNCVPGKGRARPTVLSGFLYRLLTNLTGLKFSSRFRREAARVHYPVYLCKVGGCLMSP